MVLGNQVADDSIRLKTDNRKTNILPINNPKTNNQEPAKGESPINSQYQNQYAPISLNYLVEEGVQQHRHQGKRPVQFTFQFASDLCKIIGEPTQLRRLFEQVIDCLLDQVPSELPIIGFLTQNITLTATRAAQYPMNKPLMPGLYVLLQVTIEPNHSRDLAEDPARDSAVPHSSGTQYSEPRFNEFVWGQIYDVIQNSRGGVHVVRPHALTTKVEIVLPALRL